MKPISTFVHGVIDYATSATVFALSRRAGMSPMLSTVLTGTAAGSTLYSAMTDYELSAVKVLPMKTHLTLDAMVGAMTCALPFMFWGERRAVQAAVLGIGLFELAAAFSTREESDSDPVSSLPDRVRDLIPA